MQTALKKKQKDFKNIIFASYEQIKNWPKAGPRGILQACDFINAILYPIQ